MREITTHHVEGAPATRIWAMDEPDPDAGGMCHEYVADWPDSSGSLHASGGCVTIDFQHGPIAEVGRNGLTNEALLAIVIDRLEAAQAGPFACDENHNALHYARHVLNCLQVRTRRRIAAKVEGTSQRAPGDYDGSAP